MFYGACKEGEPFGTFDFEQNMLYNHEMQPIIQWKYLKSNGVKFGQGEATGRGENNYNKMWKRNKLYNQFNYIMLKYKNGKLVWHNKMRKNIEG